MEEEIDGERLRRTIEELRAKGWSDTEIVDFLLKTMKE